MSLLSNQTFANSTTPLWASVGSGGSGGTSSRLILQVADNTTYQGAYEIQGFVGVALVSSGTDITFNGTNTVTFNTPGLYKLTLNSGFANDEVGQGADPGTTFWGYVSDETNTLVFDTSGTDGTGVNGGCIQNFIKVLAPGWSVLLVLRSSTTFTYTPALAPTLNADIEKIV